jgi:hypothetical protein
MDAHSVADSHGFDARSEAREGMFHLSWLHLKFV